MALRVGEQEFRLLRDLIEKRSGILLGNEKQYLIENRLSPLVRALKCHSYGDFYLKVKESPPTGELWTSVMDAMTTNETSWLRDRHPFVALRERLFPQFQEEIRAGKRQGINIWSAACSTGQEPYSIAMTALDCYRTCGGEKACDEQVRILATDISKAVLFRAMDGRYEPQSLRRGLPEEYLNRYFDRQDEGWTVGQKVKNLVTFKQINLQEPFVGLGPFDIVFLRNVIIYFGDKFKQELLNRIARVLAPGGYMFLGTGETVRGYTMGFDMREHSGAVFYQVSSYLAAIEKGVGYG
jgi:chemotaxis protein methyltransferase CheR